MMKSGSKQKAILVIYLSESTFVKADIETLSSFAPVMKYHFRRTRSLNGLFYQYLHLFIFLVFKIRSVQLIYSWFNDYHTFLPIVFSKLFRIRSIIIVGGFDAKGIPEINYGIFRKKDLRASLAKFSYKNANLIAPVDGSLIESINYFVRPEGFKSGILNFIPDLKTKLMVIPTGYDPGTWKRHPHIERTNSVISVASIKDPRTFQLKGFDFIIQLARELPDVTFSLVGFSDEMLEKYRSAVSPNVQLLPFIPNEELIEHYGKSKVYAQFSLTEGLPNSLCEAMLCECIPVGSAVDGIPNAIGDSGYIISVKDVNQAKEVLLEALSSDPLSGLKARDRIIELFPVQKRKDLLRSFIVSSNE